MATATIISIIGLCISAISVIAVIYFNSKGSRHTDEKEIAERVAENTKINIKLDDIAASSREIKEQVKDLVKEVQSHGDRLIKVEESCKQAHHRLNGIDDRLNGLEGKYHE